MKKSLLIFMMMAVAYFPCLGDAASMSDDSSMAHVDLAASYFQAGKADIAAEELEKVLGKNPKQTQANDLMGLIQMRSGNTKQAESYFKTAIAGDAFNGSAYNNYGLLLCQSGRFDEGMEAFGKALQYPKSIRVAQTLVNGGSCLSQKGDPGGSEKFLLKALEQEPFMPAALYQLAKVYYSTNRYEQAESRLKALHKQVQANAASTFLMYQIAVAQGRSSEAKNLFNVLKTRFTDSAETQRIKSN